MAKTKANAARTNLPEELQMQIGMKMIRLEVHESTEAKERD
jgi:hypothetical protein